MDVLSDVLSSMRLQSSVLGVFRATAPWGLDCQQAQGLVFHYVAEGECWLTAPGRSPLRLPQGHVVVLPRWGRHALVSGPGAGLEPIRDVIVRQDQPTWQPGEPTGRPVQIAFGGGGAPTQILSGVFAFDEGMASLLLGQLPEVFHFDTAAAGVRPWLAHILDFISEETTSEAPGYRVVADRLTDLLLIQLLRSHMLLHPEEAPGLLRGWNDARVGRALRAVHADPAKAWTVERMGTEAGLSRAAFAARFSAVTGFTPLEYVTRWRLQLACVKLAGGAPVAEVGEAVGYRTPFAFARAFRRQHGVTPGAYRREARR